MTHKANFNEVKKTLEGLGEALQRIFKVNTVNSLKREHEERKLELFHKNNEYNRSTWITEWDTRKKCQVIRNRPVHTIRKVKI